MNPNAGKCTTINSLGKKETLICSISLLPWCKHSHHGLHFVQNVGKRCSQLGPTGAIPSTSLLLTKPPAKVKTKV